MNQAPMWYHENRYVQLIYTPWANKRTVVEKTVLLVWGILSVGKGCEGGRSADAGIAGLSHQTVEETILDLRVQPSFAGLEAVHDCIGNPLV